MTTRVLGYLSAVLLLVVTFGTFAYPFINVNLPILARPERTQGDPARIVYFHVPMAWLAFLAFFVVLVASVAYLRTRHERWDRLGRASAEVGVVFTTLVLVTGSLWGKPMWGTWWEWDPRLTSELILFFLYLGYMGLREAIEDAQRADRASAVLAVVGVVNVPVIHYSVTWWNSLHQAPSVMRLGKPTLSAAMLWPLLVMLAGFTLFFVAVLLVRLRGEILTRERSASWVREAVGT